MAAERSIQVGDTVGGRYHIEGVLGEGGMALVFRARHLGTGRPCALKVIHPQLITRPQLMELFIREAQVGARIGQHPNIVDVFDAGADESRGVPFLAMELLQGETLEALIARGPVAPGLVRTLFEQLGSALDQAHQAGIVHRDLKPSNLFLTKSHKGEPVLKIVDFGIAKALENESTRTATQVGTPAYGAPEQFGASFRQLAERQGIVIASSISPGTDVWALGLIAYELLTGNQPGQYWGVDTLAELPLKVSIGALEPASHRAGPRSALLPPGFDAWFAVCTRRNAPERWPSAGQAAAELGRLLAGLPSGTTPLVAPPGPTPGPIAIGAAVVPTAPPWTTPAPSAPASGAFFKTEAAPPPQFTAPPGSYPSAPQYPYGPPPGGSAGSAPPPVYGAPPGYTQAAYAPAPRPASTGSGAKAGLIVGGVAAALLVVVPISVYALKRANVSAAIRECESDDKRCDEACDHDDLASCARLGGLYARGKGVARDTTRASDLDKRACDGHEALGCVELAELYQRGRVGASPDVSQALQLAAQACAMPSSAASVKATSSSPSHGAFNQAGCVLEGEILRDAPGSISRDPAKAAKLFEAACDAGDMRGCADLGAAYADGVLGFSIDDTKAAALFQRGCDDHETAGCARLAAFTLRGRGGVAKDPARATSLAQRSCDAGEDEGCWLVASYTERGDGSIPKDPAKALASYQRLCDDAYGAGCASAGEMLATGRAGGPADDTKAASLLRKGCDLGASVGCMLLGVFEEYGRGGLTKNLADANTRYRRACDGGNMTGCVYLGQNLQAGEGAEKDVNQASALYRRGCEGAEAAGCTYLGQMYADGIAGLPRDPKQAVTLFRKGCDGGSPAGCFSLAYRHENGLDGLAKSDTTARNLYRLSCDGLFPRGCLSYGVFLDRGRGGAKDTAGAADAFTRGCNGKVAGACAELAVYYNDGIGVAQDKSKAIELFRRACDGGDTWACGKLRTGGK